MTQQLPTASKKNTNTIVIAVIVIAVIGTASVIGGVMLLNSSGGILTPFDFKISANDSSGTVMQGNSIQTRININKLSGDGQVTLSADSGSSGIHCSFDPSSGSADFSSMLTMTVPTSTSTNPYSITVTATSGEKSHSTSITVSVLSAKVYVSGTVTTTGLGTHPSRIEFVDTQTGVTYTGSLSDNSYSITLYNQHTYSVTVTWDGLLWSTGTFSGGTMYVYAPVGYTSMSQSFSG